MCFAKNGKGTHNSDKNLSFLSKTKRLNTILKITFFTRRSLKNWVCQLHIWVKLAVDLIYGLVEHSQLQRIVTNVKYFSRRYSDSSNEYISFNTLTTSYLVRLWKRDATKCCGVFHLASTIANSSLNL